MAAVGDRIPAPDIGPRDRYPLVLKTLGRFVAALGMKVFSIACCDAAPPGNFHPFF